MVTHIEKGNTLSVPEYDEHKRQCIELFKHGKIRVTNNPYATPIVMIRKPDGSVRFFIEYRAINERTIRDSFPLPRIYDLIDKLREARCIGTISHLEIRLAYIQVRMFDD